MSVAEFPKLFKSFTRPDDSGGIMRIGQDKHAAFVVIYFGEIVKFH